MYCIHFVLLRVWDLRNVLADDVLLYTGRWQIEFDLIVNMRWSWKHLSL